MPIITSHIQRFFLISFMVLGIFLSIGYLQTVYAEEAAKPAAAAAQQHVVAEVVWVKGDVKAVGQDKKERPLKRRDFVYEHDTLNTGAGSSGQIVFTDSSLMSLQENSSVTIDKYKYSGADKNNNNDEFVASLAKGGFRTITGAISKAKPENYKLATPVATIGVRGTEYVAVLSPTNELSVKIEVGSIVVSNDVGAVVLSPTDKIYAQISGIRRLPEASKVMPANFKEPPALQPVTPSSELQSAAASTAAAVSPGGTPPSSGGTTPSGSSGSESTSGSGSSSGTGGSRTVGSFCIS